MPTTRTHKHFRLDAAKLKRVQKALKVATETEAVECALDRVLAEVEQDRLVRRAHREFVAGGGEIRDVFGKFEP